MGGESPKMVVEMRIESLLLLKKNCSIVVILIIMKLLPYKPKY